MINKRSILSDFLHRKDHPFSQLFKYVLCGGIAVGVDFLAFCLLAWLVFPCLGIEDPAARILSFLGFSIQAVSADVVIRNYWIIKVICFFLSNGVVYVLNVLFVFESGRHSRPVEILFFFTSSLFQFVFMWLGGLLITQGWEVTYANITMTLTAILVNYLIRKNIVFKG